MSNQPSKRHRTGRGASRNHQRGIPHRRPGYPHGPHGGYWGDAMLTGEEIIAWQPEGLTLAFVTECGPPEALPALLDYLSRDCASLNDPLRCACPASETYTGIGFLACDAGLIFQLLLEEQVQDRRKAGVPVHRHPLPMERVPNGDTNPPSFDFLS